MEKINASHCRENSADNGIIIVDFFADIASEYRRQLQNSGYKISPSLDNESIVRSYLNVYRRKISMRPRKVHKADYDTPSDLIQGERRFLAKVEAGHNLRPYQSTKLEQLNYEDGMLNDFGIQHFHLGIKEHPKNPSFMARQKILLFALVHEDDFYCIGYYNHEDWSCSALLDIIHSNWPHTISNFALKNVTDISPRYNDEQHQRLREAGVNILTRRPDGTVHVSPGGGITSAKTSVQDTRRLWDIIERCSQLEDNSKGQVMKFIYLGKFTSPVYINLRFVCRSLCIRVGDGKTFIYSSNVNIINLQL